MKPPLLGGGGYGMPHLVGGFIITLSLTKAPELKVSGAGGEATPRGLPPKAHRGSPVCRFRLTGRGSYHIAFISDNGEFCFMVSGFK